MVVNCYCNLIIYYYIIIECVRCAERRFCGPRNIIIIFYSNNLHIIKWLWFIIVIIIFIIGRFNDYLIIMFFLFFAVSLNGRCVGWAGRLRRRMVVIGWLWVVVRRGRRVRGTVGRAAGCGSEDRSAGPGNVGPPTAKRGRCNPPWRTCGKDQLTITTCKLENQLRIQMQNHFQI